MKRLTLFLGSLLLVGATSSASSQSLREASHAAGVACWKVAGDIDFDACGMVSGRSPEHTAARMAVRALYEIRSKFVQDCQATRNLIVCQEQAELDMAFGLPTLSELASPKSTNRR